MKKLFAFRFVFIALLALVGASIATPSHAQGNIQFSIAKGGWIIGASAGQGTLTLGGRSYPISIGGLSAGLVFGGSVTDFRGTVTGIRLASRADWWSTPWSARQSFGPAGGLRSSGRPPT